MADVISKKARSWDFPAIVPEMLRTTQLPQPLAQTAKKAKGASDPFWTFYANPRHNAQFWDVQTRDFNSAVEDKPDEGRYNLIQGRSATGQNDQAAKEEMSAIWRGAGCRKNISGVPAGRSVFHLTSPLIGLLGRVVLGRTFRVCP